MKVFSTVLCLLASATLALGQPAVAYQTPAVAYHRPAVAYHQPAVYGVQPGHSAGSHAAQQAANQAYLNQVQGATGHSGYNHQLRAADVAAGDRANHDQSGYRDYDLTGAHGAAARHNHQRNQFARSRGAGYERAYAYDKMAGNQDIGSDHGSYGVQYGLNDDTGFRNAGGYGRYGHQRTAAQDQLGAAGHNQLAHLNSGSAGYAHGHSGEAVMTPTTVYEAQPAKTLVEPAQTYIQPGKTIVQPAKAYYAAAPTYASPLVHYSAPVATYAAPVAAYHAGPYTYATAPVAHYH